MAGTLTSTDIDRMVIEAISYKEEDKQYKESLLASSELETLIHNLQVRSTWKSVSSADREIIKKECRKASKWMASCQVRSKTDSYHWHLRVGS